jgi:hypothetical protein
VQAIAFVAWRDIRRRWLGTVAAALLVGIVGAVVLSTVAGARRSDSALRRFNAYSRSADIELTLAPPSAAQMADFARTPGIATLAVLRTYAVQPTNIPIQNLAMGAALNGTMNNAVDRPRLISGRLENPKVADQIDIGESLAHLTHLRIGDSLDLASWTPAQIARIISSGQFVQPAGPPVRLRIIGIVRRPLDLGERGGQGGVVVLPQAFNTVYGHRIGTFSGLVLRIRTVEPADVPAVTASAQRIFAHVPTFAIQNLNIDTTGAGDAIHVLAIALFIFAAVTAIAGLGAIAIVLDRELSSARPQQPTLQALGLSRRQRFAISSTRVLFAAVSGALIAVAAAVVVSPLFPFGIARRADPDPGIHADWVALGLGCIGILLTVIATGAVAAVRATRSPSNARARHQSKVATRALELSRAASLPVSTSAGLRMVLDRGGEDQSVPVRSALFATTFGAAGLTALIVFSAGVAHLASTPSMYGSRFDFKIETTQDPACNSQNGGVGSVSGVATLDAICYDNIELDGRAGVGFGDIPLRGAVGPEVVSGHAPGTDREVALGAATLAALRKHLGDTITAQGPGGRAVFRVVGVVAFPQLGDPQPVADGAWFTEPGFNILLGPPGNPSSQNFTRFLVGTFKPGVNRTALDAHIQKLLFDPKAPQATPATGPTEPVEITRLRQTDWFPVALAVLLAFLAFAALSHTLVTGTRRRRRELAILKTLGFKQRQVRGAVESQATALAIAGLLIGIPVGLLAGTSIWRSVANSVGVRNSPVIPVWVLLVLIASALLAVNAVAYLPARIASRVQPTRALRSE